MRSLAVEVDLLSKFAFPDFLKSMRVESAFESLFEILLFQVYLHSFVLLFFGLITFRIKAFLLRTLQKLESLELEAED